MSKKIFKGIKQVTEGNYASERDYLYLVSRTNGNGYIALNGKRYGDDSDEPVGDKSYFSLENKSNSTGTISLDNFGSNSPNLEYSFDATDWETYSSAISVPAGETVYFRGNNPSGFSSSESVYSTFSLSGEFDGDGNIMTLIDYENVPNTIPASYCFYKLFNGAGGLKSTPNLPATGLTEGCYKAMFYACSGLTVSPELPAMAIPTRAYQDMFNTCSSLIDAPELPATTLSGGYCYASMFKRCTSLLTAPLTLPATALTEYCYEQMFNYCSALAVAPDLPALTMVSNCYNTMFANNPTLTTPPNLPATTLAASCYTNLFRGCTSLRTAPDLPAKNLVSNCYTSMFANCRNLNYIKALFLTTPSDSFTKNWVSGVSASGTFVRDTDATWNVVGTNGIPTGWTVVFDVRNGTVLYETDGTTGLLGLNESSLGDNNWQLTGQTFYAYSYLRCYIKASSLSASQPTPAMVIELPLDDASAYGNCYLASGNIIVPFNRNRQFNACVAVDSTKTKFKVVHENTLWDVSSSDANSASDGRYLYKIVGYTE